MHLENVPPAAYLEVRVSLVVEVRGEANGIGAVWVRHPEFWLMVRRLVVWLSD